MSSGSIQKLTSNIKAGGCAAKLSPAELASILQHIEILKPPALLTGLDGFEDAAVYRISDDLAIIQTIDFFPPVVDDPFLYGRIAAVNALSDVYAMGGRPVLALNVLGFPTCDYPLEVAAQIVQGGAAAVKEAGAALAGGHSVQTREPLYGLSVTGIVNPSRILTNSGARSGDAIVVTKPIGTGVCLLAIKGDLLDERDRRTVFDSISTLNAAALDVALKYDIHGATDVTGFGLIGHLREMAVASKVSACLFSSKVPLLPGARSYAEMGLVPAGAYANRNAYSGENLIIRSDVEMALADLFFDPQTAGGLLLSCKPDHADLLVGELEQSGCTAAIIGTFSKDNPGIVEVV